MKIGERIIHLLKEKRKKQVDLANYLNVSPSTINGWANANKNPASETIIPICEFLEVSPEYLLTGIEKSSPLLRDDELELLKYYNALPELERGRVLARLEDKAQTAEDQQGRVG